jgi:AcrR family transcriptional regulator
MDKNKVVITTDFNEIEAFNAAVNIFWKKGYEGATLDDLTAAMEISRPALNAAFGTKQELFKLVLERYKENTSFFIGETLALPDIQAVIKTLLQKVTDFLALPSNAHSCLSLQSAIDPLYGNINKWNGSASS